MTIVKMDFQRIVATGLKRCNTNVLFCVLQHFLPGPMALHFGRWRIDPQVFTRQIAFISIIEDDFQHPALLVQFDVSGSGHGILKSHT
jgi:hypothetical protein